MADDVAELVDLFVARVERFRDAMAKRLVRDALEEADAQLASEEGRRARPRRAGKRRPAIERKPARQVSNGYPGPSADELRKRALVRARVAAVGLVPKPAHACISDAQPGAGAGESSAPPSPGPRGDDPWPEAAVLRELVGRPRAPRAEPATCAISQTDPSCLSAQTPVVPVPAAIDAAAALPARAPRRRRRSFGAIKEDGGTFLARWQEAGKRRGRRGFATREDAAAFLDRRREDLWTSANPTPANIPMKETHCPPSVSDLAPTKTAENYSENYSAPAPAPVELLGATAAEVEQVGSLWVVRWRQGRRTRMESGFRSREEAEAFAASRCSTPATPPPPVLIGPGNAARAAAIANRSGAANDVAPELELVPAAPPAEVSRPAPAPTDAPFDFPRDQLGRLKPAMRRVVALRLDGMEVREIGARLGLSLNHVHHLLKDARGQPKNDAHAAYLARAARVVAQRERAMEGEDDQPAADRPARAPRSCKICRRPGHNAVTCSERLHGLRRLMAIEAAADRLYGRSPPASAPAPTASPGPQLEEAAAAGADASRADEPRERDDDTDFSEFLAPEVPAPAAPTDAFAAPEVSPWDPGEAPANDPCPTVDLARARIEARSGSARHTRGSVTIAAKQLQGAERRAGALVVYPDDIERPRTRGDCENQPRPCPWVSCSAHLYLDVGADGALQLNHPEREVWEMAETCALDIADRGGVPLEIVGDALNVSRERIRQIEERALQVMKRRSRALEMAAPEPPIGNEAAG